MAEQEEPVGKVLLVFEFDGKFTSLLGCESFGCELEIEMQRHLMEGETLKFVEVKHPPLAKRHRHLFDQAVEEVQNMDK